MSNSHRYTRRSQPDHNPRPNELALADHLRAAAGPHRVRIVVDAGHIHNYERLLQDDVMYLVVPPRRATTPSPDFTMKDAFEVAARPSRTKSQ